MRLIFSLLFISVSFPLLAQSFISYFTGDTLNVDVDPDFGIVMMGGAGENDEAMKWFLERANGGDIVVLRASGADGYNDYMFSELGVEVNSVESIVFNDASAALDPYVISQVQNAEAIWMAGGDQWNYVSFWRGSPIEDAINDLINVRTGVVGGTSAGMAVLGEYCFSAETTTIYSDEALENPYHPALTIGNDFLVAPFLHNVITDTHYDARNRYGRHVTFMARVATDFLTYPLGIACDEYTAVCVDSEGMAWCFGEAPVFDDYAYFIRPDCEGDYLPQNCTSEQPLTWIQDDRALKALRINATMDGDQYLNLNDWVQHQGGTWFDWRVDNGQFMSSEGDAPDCIAGLDDAAFADEEMVVWPTPADEFIYVYSPQHRVYVVSDLNGNRVTQGALQPGNNRISCQNWSPGYYLFESDQFRQKIAIMR